MRKFILLIYLNLICCYLFSQNLEVTGTPSYISYDGDIPVLGISPFPSKFPYSIILCVHVDDNIRLNDNSNLVLILDNKEIVTCEFLTKSEIDEHIILPGKYHTWHFKKEPSAIFGINKTDKSKLTSNACTKFILYKVDEFGSPKKTIYNISIDNKYDIKYLLEYYEKQKYY